MKYQVIHILILFLFLLNAVDANAKWGERGKNIQKKTYEEIAVIHKNKTVEQLTKILKQDESMLIKQAQKLAKMELALKSSKKAFMDNQMAIYIQKNALKKAWKQDPTSLTAKSIQRELTKLRSQGNALKRAIDKNLDKTNSFKQMTSSLKKKVFNMKNKLGYIDKMGNILKYNEAVGAGGGTLGEIAAWWEGNSSFKNVVIRATREGGKAAVSIGTGIVVGTLSTAATFNPYATGAAVVVSTVTAEEIYDATIGKSLDYFMDREHDAINKYKVDPEKLYKMREAKRKKAFEENKKMLTKIGEKQDEYNDELRKYIEERKQLWAKAEEEMRKAEEEQLKIEREQTPSVVQKPSKKKIKPGETVNITIETKGGLLPITYSGVLSYVVETGYDRYLVVYKWTPEKNLEPGVYEFSINATSASGKVGRHTLAIEVEDPNPAPEPIAKPTENYKTDTDGERLYSASELNIKEIPGAEIRKMIYKVNGIYYGHCETPADIKTQKFEIQLGVDPQNIEGKLGIVHLSQLFGNKTIPLSEETIEKLRKQFPYLPEEDIKKTGKVYFNVFGRYKKFDPVTGRIWGELDGESSVYQTFVPKADFKGFLEAKLNNGIITGTVTFKMGNKDYSFPFTAKQ